MITLQVADLVIIASRTLGLDTGQVLDLLDPAAAEHALAQTLPGSEPGDPATHAAALLHALVHQRPLRRGNQQVALAAMLQFLALNGWEADLDPPGPVKVVMAELAAGRLGTEALADWLAPRLRPRDRAAARAEQESLPGRPVSLAVRIKSATMRTQPTGMFRRFTDGARRVVRLAEEEARLLRHDHVSAEHLLLGLLYEGEGMAARALDSLGLSRDDVRGQLTEIIGHGQNPAAGPLSFTPQAKKVLELSLREALALGRLYIGTEHLLLGLLRDSEGIAAQVLTGLGAGHARVRDRVLDLLADQCTPTAAGEAGLTTAGPQLLTDLADAAEQLSRVRQQKEAAFGAGDLDAAAALRDRERQLLADKQLLENQLTADPGPRAIIAENRRLHRELDRLRDLLRRHGIEPDGGTARTA
ncbi:MAG: Clp protease N-terminal domain-containing protein [Streptosporangiaceae bacterium]